MTYEYISREAAIKATEDADVMCDIPADAYRVLMRYVERIPAAEVVPVRHGRWKKSYADNEAFGVRPFFRYCSECHEATVHQYTYCPNCGARMDGDGDV